jgi:hypothetical protein
MTRLAPIALIVCLCATAAHAVDGKWKASTEDDRPERIYLGLDYGRTSNMGTMYATSAFTGLTADQIHAETSTPVRFTLEREAGRVSFEGSFRAGRGAGHFTFEPSAGYLDAVRKLGVDVSSRERSPVQDERLLALVLLDVSTDYIRSMIAEGYRVPLDEFQTMRIFDVTPSYVQAMRALGYDEITADELVSTRIHGVTPDYVREVRESKWDLSLDELVQSRIHGVTPQFRAEMEKLGYRLSFDDLTAFRIHGVTPEWIDQLRKLGYDHLEADDLVSTRIFQVTPEFIRSVAAAGYRDLPMSDLISMRVQGLDVEDLPPRRAL